MFKLWTLPSPPLTSLLFIRSVISGAGGHCDEEAGEGRYDRDGGGRGRRGGDGGPGGAGSGHGGETDDEEVIQGP